MTTLQTKIHGYAVDLDTDMGDGATGCWVSKKCVVDGSLQECSASLQLLEAGGCLITDFGYDGDAVPAPTLALIADWAEANGY